MTKPLVFISHISEERDLAVLLQDLVQKSFLGMIDVFVSSDGHSIPPGTRWINVITSALERCCVEIVLCSPKSVSRPWINFEAGAGWIREISVIPLCHSGMSPGKLPAPLRDLQSEVASDQASINRIVAVLANSLDASSPTVDTGEFVIKVARFEEQYMFWDLCNEYFRKLSSIKSGVLAELRTGFPVKLRIRETEEATLRSLMQEFFTPNQLLNLHRLGNPQNTPNGISYEHMLVPGSRLGDILKDTRLNSAS